MSKTKILRLSAACSCICSCSSFCSKKPWSGDSSDTKVYPLRQRFRFQTVMVGLKNHDPIFDRLIKTKGGQVLDKIGVLSVSLVKVPKLFLNNHRW